MEEKQKEKKAHSHPRSSDLTSKRNISRMIEVAKELNEVGYFNPPLNLTDPTSLMEAVKQVKKNRFGRPMKIKEAKARKKNAAESSAMAMNFPGLKEKQEAEAKAKAMYFLVREEEKAEAEVAAQIAAMTISVHSLKKKKQEETPMARTPAAAAAMATTEIEDYDLCMSLWRKNLSFTRHPRDFLFYNKEEDKENEHYKHFMTLVEESQGYYTPKVPEGVKISYARPRAFPPHMFGFMEERARDALRWYNKEKKEKETFELEKVECGTQIDACGILCLIAFIARGSVSGVEQPFRAKVLYGVGGVVTVERCDKVTESCARFTRLNGRCCEMVNESGG